MTSLTAVKFQLHVLNPNCSLNHPVAAVAKSPEEGSKEGAGDKGGGRKETSQHCASGPAPPPSSAAGAHHGRPAGWTQPGTPHPSPEAAQPESARHPAGC